MSKKKDSSNKTQEEKAPEEKAPEEKAPEEKAPEEKSPEEKAAGAAEVYRVCEGKAITTSRGIISEGEEIKIKDLPGGMEAIKAFIKKGYVVQDNA